MIKVYIASSFSLIDKVKRIVEILEYHGFIITQKWWERVYIRNGKNYLTTELKKINNDLPPDIFYSLPETLESFRLDSNGIENADVFLLVASDDVEYNYKGALVEFGIAYKLHLNCFVIGKLRNSVMFLPLTRCDDAFDFINRVKVMI